MSPTCDPVEPWLLPVPAMPNSSRNPGAVVNTGVDTPANVAICADAVDVAEITIMPLPDPVAAVTVASSTTATVQRAVSPQIELSASSTAHYSINVPTRNPMTETTSSTGAAFRQNLAQPAEKSTCECDHRT